MTVMANPPLLTVVGCSVVRRGVVAACAAGRLACGGVGGRRFLLCLEEPCRELATAHPEVGGRAGGNRRRPGVWAPKHAGSSACTRTGMKEGGRVVLGGGGHADRHGWSVRGECADAACLPAAAGGLAAVPGLSLARAPSPPYAAQWGACCMASAALGVRAKLRRAAMTLSACRRSPPPPSPLPALAPLAPPPILPASLLSPGHPQAAAPHPELHPDGVEPQPLLQLARAPHRAAAQAVERDHQPVRGRVAQQ